MNNTVLENFDCVIMLTFSDWFTELRSNRFHYAKRFSSTTKVFFVQVNGKGKVIETLPTEFENIEVVKLSSSHNIEGFNRLLNHVWSKNFSRPLFWVYNPHFIDLLNSLKSAQIVFHSTEDYFSPELGVDDDFLRKVKQTILSSRLVVAVSPGVAERIVANTPHAVNLVVAENGCDFPTWSNYRSTPKERSVVYQGGINHKLDFDLINFVIDDNPDVNFYFYGKVNGVVKGWDKVLSKKNVIYKGNVAVEELVKEVSKHAVGIVPFEKTDLMVKRSLPLKFYEYLSAGLRVVSITINSLPKELYLRADNFQDFSHQIRRALDEKLTDEQLKSQEEECKKADYDSKFNLVVSRINESRFARRKLKGFLIVDMNSMANQAIKQHVDGIINSSEIEFEIVDIRYFNLLKKQELHFVDVILIHFCVRIFGTLITPKTVKLLNEFEGHKGLFIQDEYDEFLFTRERLKAIQFTVIYTCVPEDQIEEVYPRAIFKNTKFLQCYTGYITEELLKLKERLGDGSGPRDFDVFYRGRILPLFYGSLGYQKYNIGKRFKELIYERQLGLSNDIEVDDSLRIYGDEWYARLTRSKTMLGTESGSNVFDFDGHLKQFLNDVSNSSSSLEEKIDKVVARYEGKVKMNQISPKIFEMFASGCVPVLFKGQYSGLISMNENFIGLEPDFSNLDEVVLKIRDEKLLQKIRQNNFSYITERKDIYFETFVRSKIDHILIPSISLFPKRSDQEIFQKMWIVPVFFLSPSNLKQAFKRLLVKGLKSSLGLGSRYFKYDSEMAYEQIKRYLRPN